MNDAPPLRIWAVLPVKQLSAAKRRLGNLADTDRRSLIDAMLADVLDAITAAERIEGTIVVSSEPLAWDHANAAEAEVVSDRDDQGHSQAARRGAERAVRLGADAVLMLPGDTPLVTDAELDGLAERAAPRSVGIAPDRHGTGTNALVLTPPDGMIPSFGPGSYARHRTLGDRAGLEVRAERIKGLALDLDTPDDLAELRTTLRAEPDRAPATAEVLRGLRLP